MMYNKLQRDTPVGDIRNITLFFLNSILSLLTFIYQWMLNEFFKPMRVKLGERR